MHSWQSPDVPEFPHRVDGSDSKASIASLPPLRLYDTADDQVKDVQTPGDSSAVGMYVCGITPYDSTHLGHAATYVTFDVVNRYLRAAGFPINYVQNVTDVDDPLFERADRDGVDWRELGIEQTDLFRSDMENLAVIAPEHYIGAVESVDEVVTLVKNLLDKGAAYQLDGEYADVYADHTYTSQFGYESRYDHDTMLELFAERGGDPERKEKKHPLDALLWRAHREGEPEWEAPFGSGRPGWHIECAAIAANRLGSQFSIQGGGFDLRYPHHEYSAAHVEAGWDSDRMANHYVHTGMIGLDGTKMSKSLGNLEFVSELVANGADPSAIRVGLYAHHYREDRDWSADLLSTAEKQLAAWRQAAQAETDAQRAADTVNQVAAALANDLDTPAVVSILDAWAHDVDNQSQKTGENELTAAGTMVQNAVDALLGVKL